MSRLHARAFGVLTAALVLSACGGVPLRTIGPVVVALPDLLSLDVTLPRGDIEVVSDLPEGSANATAELEVFAAGAPMASDSHPEMVIEDVDGRIIASCWGTLTMRGCTAVCLAMSDKAADNEILGPGGTLENRLEAGGPITLRVDPDSDPSFDNEFVKIGAVQELFWSVVNQGRPEIQGPEDVEFELVPYQKVYTCSGGSITYLKP